MSEQRARIVFYPEELKALAISTVALGFAFFYPGIGTLLSTPPQTTLFLFLVYLGIVALAFVPHELAHKITAMKKGCIAVYEMFPTGLMFAIALAILSNGSFVFAAPGAVVIYTHYADLWGRVHAVRLSKRDDAIISISGPVANIVFAVLLVVVGLLATPGSLVSWVSLEAAHVNAFLAFFNLLPIPPLDGSKVFATERVWWGVAILASLVLLVLF